jgi:hypothetical protein
MKTAQRKALAENQRLATTLEDRRTPAEAIRAKCLDCNLNAHEVRWCPATGCPLWRWRFGSRPETTLRKQPEFLDEAFVLAGPGVER